MKRTSFFSSLLALIVLLACSIQVGGKPQEAKDVFVPEVPGISVEEWVTGLDVPWSLIFFPDEEGRALVSERPGRIRLIKHGRLMEEPYATLKAAPVGEGGLMGLALHPRYPQEPYVYAMYTYREKAQLFNRVLRLKDTGDKGVFDRTIIDGIPGGRFHNGGRIAFGPDGMLYIAAGEAFKAHLAQDIKSLGGKILRVTPEGRVPHDNPFAGSPVYSYGNRNPQGIAWHPATGELFESEHGPSGEFGRFANDEINLIVKGGNYGWPKAVGAPGLRQYIDPVVVWEKTTPPSGIAFVKGNLFAGLKGDLFVATLRSEALIRIRLERKNGAYHASLIERWFATDFRKGKYGRLRDVVEGPDGALYLLTNNRDGRGTPRPGDDKILRIFPKR